MKITIATATYNRCGLIKRLYESLIVQKNLNFQWIVVDDGSIDDTTSYMKQIMEENKIKILYYKKNNGGKHTAINYAVEKCNTDYIFLVDSDDVLPLDSIDIIYEKIKYIEHAPSLNIAGICGLKAHLDNKIVGNALDADLTCSYLTYRYKYGVTGDKAEIFKTSILKKYRFPEFKGELFCPEALVWNRISRDYNMYFFNRIIYLCEYQDGGLSDKSIELRRKSPQATLLYYAELSSSDINSYHKIKASVNFWRFYFSSNIPTNIVVNKKLDNIIFKAAGFLFSRIL